jgi:hypothetical protein
MAIKAAAASVHITASSPVYASFAALHQVLGVFRAEPAITGEGVQWRPVALAEPSERLGCPFGVTLGRFQHEAPACRINPAWSCAAER